MQKTEKASKLAGRRERVKKAGKSRQEKASKRKQVRASRRERVKKAGKSRQEKASKRKQVNKPAGEGE